MTKNKNLNYYLGKHKCGVILYILTIIIACVCSGATTILFANFLSYVTVASYELALRFLVFAGVTTILCRFGWWSNYFIYYKVSNVIWKEIAKDLTNRSFMLASSTFSENNSGAFVQRIMNDPNEALSQLSSIVEILAETITSVVIVTYIVTLNWLIGLLYISVLLVAFVIEIFRKKIGKKNKLKTKKINDKTYSLVTEIVKSEKDIKALGLEEKLYETSNVSFEEYKNQRCKADVIDLSFWNTRNVILELFGIAVLVLGIYMMQVKTITIATYILLYSYRDNLFFLVWNVGAMFKLFTDISVSNSRMFSLYDEKIYPAEKFGDITKEKVEGRIQFDNVEFAYSEIVESKEDDEEFAKKRKPVEHVKKEPIFNDLSFVIEPNTTVAFVGKSGSGKSTILSLIAKLIEADKGIVKIDDVDIRDLTKQSLRDNISLINQFPYIFDMSIKENLLLVKKDATDEELWDVLKRASFDEDVKSMPKGLDTKVGETGVKLSGGQRQRLAIARALLKQTKIILFDESTSSLDNFAQSNIQKSIENMKGQHTIVIVAHRLSTIKNVDKIYFLENGKIVDSGTFEELFNNNTQFQNMFLIENI